MAIFMVVVTHFIVLKHFKNRRIMNKIKIVAVNFVITFTGMLLIELCFGNWIFDNKLGELNLIRSRTTKFNLNGLYNSPNDPIVYKRDEYGLRGRYNKVNEINLLTVGGSTTDQRYISEGQTWQDILQNTYESEGINVAIANAGIDGQTTYGHIKNFEYWFPSLPGLHPKYILFYVGLNDFHINEGYGFDRLKTNSEDSFMPLIRKNSSIYRLLRTIRGVINAEVKENIGHRKIDFTGIKYTRWAMQIDYSFMNKRLEEYRERLAVLIEKT